MAIGRIQVGNTQRQTSGVQASEADFGAGIASAINEMGAALGAAAETQVDVLAAAKARQRKEKRFDLEHSWIDLQSEFDREQERHKLTTQEDAAGFTNNTHERIGQLEKDFLAKIDDPDLAREWQVKIADYKRTHTWEAYKYEYEKGNEKFGRVLDQNVNRLGSSIMTGEKTYDEAMAQVESLIREGDFQEGTREKLRQSTEMHFRGIQMQYEIGEKLATNEILETTPPEWNRLFGAIATRESGGKFNIRYAEGKPGGEVFTDYARHPRVYENGPHGKSSAAGAFMITYDTWVDLGFEDKPFTPKNQLAAAQKLARQRYNQVKPLGLTLDQVLARGNPTELLSIKSTLDKTWVAFQHMKDAEFLSFVTGQQAVDFGQDVPNVWADPRFDSLPHDQKWSLYQSAEQQFSQQESAFAERDRQQRELVLQDALLKAEQGLYKASDQLRLQQEGVFKNAADRKLYDTAVKKYEDDVRVGQEVGDWMAGDRGVPLSKPIHEDAMNKVLKNSGVLDRIRDMTPNAEASVTSLGIEAGFLPSAMADQMLAMLEDSNPDKQAWAGKVLATIDAVNPYVLQNTSGFSGKQLSKVSFLGNAGNLFNSPQQAIESWEMINDPENAAFVEQRVKEAELELQDISSDDIANKVFDTMFEGQPDIPLNQTQNFQLGSEYQKAYLEGYKYYGDRDAAERYAGSVIQKSWGVTELEGRKRLAKWSPDKFYPNAAMITSQVQDEIEAQGLPRDTQFEIVAHAGTAAEGKAWANKETGAEHNASYDIILFDGEGGQIRMLSEDGSAWSFDGGVETLPDGSVRFNDHTEDTKEKVDTQTRVANEASKVNKIQSALNTLYSERNRVITDPARAEENAAEIKALEGERDAINRVINAERARLGETSNPLSDMSETDLDKQIARVEKMFGFAAKYHPKYKELLAERDLRNWRLNNEGGPQ